MYKCIESKKEKYEHNWLYVSLILTSILLYTVTIGFNVLNTLGTAYPLFKSNVGNISDKYPIEITPAGWVFSTVWTIIFIWQYIWLIYAFICLFRKTNKGDYVYRAESFIHFGILIAFMINNSMVIAWLFLWDNFIFGWSLFVISVSAISLHVLLFISHRKSYNSYDSMIKHDLKVDVWINRFLLQNGVAFFLTWLSLATNLNFAIFLTYEAGVEVSISSTAALVVIFLIVVVYFILENFIWQRYLLYTFTPWFVLNLALIGSIAKNYVASSPTRNNIMTVVIFVIILLFTITKIVMCILYHSKLKHKLNTYLCKKKPVANADIE